MIPGADYLGIAEIRKGSAGSRATRERSPRQPWGEEHRPAETRLARLIGARQMVNETKRTGGSSSSPKTKASMAASEWRGGSRRAREWERLTNGACAPT